MTIAQSMIPDDSAVTGLRLNDVAIPGSYGPSADDKQGFGG